MADVIALAVGKDSTNRRVAFHNLVDELFDAHVEDFQAEPEALVFFCGSLKGKGRVSWTMFGDAYDASTAMLSRAAVALMMELAPD